MSKSIAPSQFAAWLCLIAAVITTPVSADTEPERFEAADSEGVVATRNGNSLYLHVEAGVTGPISIPRLAAPLRSMHWQGHGGKNDIALKPEQNTWSVSWNKRPEGAGRLVLEFDSRPVVIEKDGWVNASGDGSFYLPAHRAITHGEKIRYEPQPNKNTLGYWTGKQDAAGWRLNLNDPGRFSVAILQGCGKGQGGSDATITFVSNTDDKSSIDFKVVETGHFQNFQWVHVGEIEFSMPGGITVFVQPKQIKKAALMDIRAIHLIRLPDKKK